MYLNLGCGASQLGAPWINVDNFRSIFAENDPELRRIESLPNYVNADLSGPLPFEDGCADGVLASHVLEHFDAQGGLKFLKEIKRVLAQRGPVLVSVPDVAYFRKVYPEDRNENWPRLFGTIDPKNPIPTFFEAALWFNEHAAILGEDALWAYLTMAGFSDVRRVDPYGLQTVIYGQEDTVVQIMHRELNRGKFSLVMGARK